jgi:prepilin-type N-terminal cleavage/methylation domain-containing protein
MLIKQQNRTIFGFSLIELLVVISIIGVLSAVLVANFMGMRERARDAQKIQDLYAVKNALRMYYNDTQSYPLGSTLDVLTVGSSYVTSLIGVSGYTYVPGPGGDSFKLTVGLEAGAGNEDIDSQTKCGISPVVDKVFAVCGN